MNCAVQSRAKYLTVAKQMKAYEDLLYEQWRQQVEATLPSLLKRNLLAKPGSVKPDTKAGETGGEAENADGSNAFYCFIIFMLLKPIKVFRL